ncbi:hypothetical protein NE237_012581 [Protea cynaroides]|uniref:Uncharacterized protein n=1 Tax=Protea cynaroides TaxID=273540 RepID=A0A9Q0GXR4_9MAGN|nr:hypothetical protein NE237_012581 [Protea cynaroides]
MLPIDPSFSVERGTVERGTEHTEQLVQEALWMCGIGQSSYLCLLSELINHINLMIQQISTSLLVNLSISDGRKRAMGGCMGALMKMVEFSKPNELVSKKLPVSVILAIMAGGGKSCRKRIAAVGVFPFLQKLTDEDVQSLAKKAAETFVLVIDEEGAESLISELLKGVGDIWASIRRNSYSVTIAAPWEALSRVVGSVPKEVLPSYIKEEQFLYLYLVSVFLKLLNRCFQFFFGTVCSRSALALGKLSAICTRVDPLVSDLLSMLQHQMVASGRQC